MLILDGHNGIINQTKNTSDIFLSNAFRHPIGIHDSIFPTQWWNWNI